MTIKRRLFLSNVLMIVVPALVTALTGLLCMVMVVSVLRQGSGLGYEEGGELAWIGRTCREVLQEAPADSGSREIRQIVSLLDGSAMRLVLTEDGRPVYTFGTEQADDARLLQSAESLDCDPVQVSTGSRGIYLTRLTYQGRTMQLALFGTPGEHTGEAVKAAVALSALLILLARAISEWRRTAFSPALCSAGWRSRWTCWLPASAASGRAIWTSGSPMPGRTSLRRCAARSMRWPPG